LASVLGGFTVQNGNAGILGSPFVSIGGGVLIQNSSPTISGNVIRNNVACGGGGGIGSFFGSPLIQGNVVRGNAQSNNCSGGIGGGGIGVIGFSSAQIIDNTITGNSWPGDGGGISLSSAGTPNISGNFISGNIAGGEGGGIFMVNHSDASITQNIITANSASQGAGLYWLVPLGNRGPLLLNNTIANNDSQQGSGVFAGGFDFETELINNIIVGKVGQTTVFCANPNDPVPPVFRFNDVLASQGSNYGGICQDQTGINGNISTDPLFIDGTNANFRLQSNSPVIDAGDNYAPSLPATDFEGKERIVDGNTDTLSVVDMGAYEAPLSGLYVSVDISPGEFPNIINPKKQGNVAVAALSSGEFNPPVRIDGTSLTFGRTGFEQSLVSCDFFSDVNKDKIPDLVCHFSAQRAAFQSGDSKGILRGKTLDGTPIAGVDSVVVLPK
jgi:hypothetical protein